MNANICLLLNLASTWAMVGLIWLIQVVHYPLFAKVGEAQFKSYTEDHQRLITYIVLPLMFCELVTACLLWVSRPAGVSSVTVLVGIVLVFLVWSSTFFLQVPQHGQLLSGFDSQVHAKLVSGNWIRTIAWTLRGFLVAYMAWVVMSEASGL